MGRGPDVRPRWIHVRGPGRSEPTEMGGRQPSDDSREDCRRGSGSIYSKSARARPDWRMTLARVPSLSSACRGTGTVVVDVALRRCMTAWLPRRLTSLKPFSSRMRQTSAPERRRSLLANRNLERTHFDVYPKALGEFGWRRHLEKQLQRLGEIRTSLVCRITLARNIDIRAESDVSVPFSPSDGGEASGAMHGSIVAQAAEAVNSGTGVTPFASVAPGDRACHERGSEAGGGRPSPFGLRRTAFA